MEKIIHYVNIPYHLANHVVGEHHTPLHRKLAGFFVMAIGVILAHASSHVSNIIIAIFGDLIGYSIHGTGLIPFIHDLEASAPKKNENETKCETC